MDYPKIKDRQYIRISPYVEIVQKTVSLNSKRIELFHGVRGGDYVCMVGFTEDFRVPLVRQYRPIIEKYTWELPAGTLEPNENPRECALRELEEETGYKSNNLQSLGTYSADTGRLEIPMHGFWTHSMEHTNNWSPEAHVETNLFSVEEVYALIEDQSFNHIGHVAIFILAERAAIRHHKKDS